MNESQQKARSRSETSPEGNTIQIDFYAKLESVEHGAPENTWYVANSTRASEVVQDCLRPGTGMVKLDVFRL